ncbi:MAG: adenylate/guanylate cyclase domain-containing protein [Chloroflexota bacterium]
MTCSTCATDNEPGRKFCRECGSSLALACPACGTSNDPAAKFCGECGATLAGGVPSGASGDRRPAGGATPAPARMPVAERRLVSVLFADLVGFTTISETRDAEDVRELLGRYFDLCREVIGRYGGTVEKFIGDAVMAVWGTPIAQEDDAERAVRAALDLVGTVHRLGEDAGIPDLALRAGVLTGEAAVTLGATDQGMVAGDLVNTASRLQSVAPPGWVLVGEATRRASSEAIAYESAGDQEMKGKAAPVPAYRALRVIAQRRGEGRREQLEAPFVARDAEVRLIKDFFHATSRERGVRLVSVLGQAGIGKSRLAWEFLKYIDGLKEDVYWHQGRSPSYGDGITFWALGEMVRMRLRVGESEDEAVTRARLTETLDQFVPDADERRLIEGALLQLLGVEERPGRDRGELFAAWRAFFERIAESGTVVLVFEDLQWADEGLIDFIEEMLAWSRGRSIYIITLARPELLDRRPTWGAGQRAFTSIGLGPLEDAEMREMLAGFVPGLPEAAVRTILGRAEGVPLYAVETVRMLLNDGRLERDGDAYRPVGDLTDLAVPESLHALIAARMDGLPPNERSILQDAAVLGLSFTLGSLAAVAGVAAADVEQVVRHLARRELLALDVDPRSPERGQYRFVQGLIQEVAYGTLAKRDRRARHLAAARHYESLGDDELAGVLAQHYLDAYRAHPDGPEGAAVAGQARLALRGAAQRAAGLGSNASAHGYLALALEVAGSPGEELELQRAAGESAAEAGLFDVSIGHLERAVELAAQSGDHPARRRAIALLGDVLTEGHHERGLKLVSEAFDEPGLGPDDEGYLEIAAVYSKFLMRTGEGTRSVAVADAALPSAESRGDRPAILDLLITRGTALANLDRPMEAIATLTGARVLADRYGETPAFLRASINLAYSLEPDDPRAGYEVSLDGLVRARRLGHRWAIRYLLGNACDSALEVGEWDWVMEQVGEELSRELEPPDQIFYGSYDARIRASRGEDVTAQTSHLRALASQFDDPQFLEQADEPSVLHALASGDLGRTLEICREAIAREHRGFKGAVYGARAATWLGDAAAARDMVTAWQGARAGRQTDAIRASMEAGLAALEGRSQDARAGFGEAQREFRDLGLAVPLALCQLDIVITGSMEAGERQRAADEARILFERLGMRPYLERLDAALSAQPGKVASAPITAEGVGQGV